MKPIAAMSAATVRTGVPQDMISQLRGFSVDPIIPGIR
ncbi:hypothetical protein [Alloactinosynnema sp. L-07]|nr:hypothetical protein [Alloactinosynnema sp. L-07]